MRSVFLTIRLTGLLLLACCFNANAEVNPETVTVSVKNVSVLQVFDIIRKQTHYSIFYDKDMLEGARPVSVNVKDKPLVEFLDLVLKDQPFSFYIEQQTIFIKRKKAISPEPAVNTAIHTPPPVPPISGTVRDADGNPLAGVNIVIKGTNRGTATDADGKFSLNVDPGQVLVISSIGFQTREIVVGNETVFQIQLAGENKSLNEVVVTALGIRKAVKSLTYSVDNVKGDELNKAKETNVINSLQGKVAGLTITKNAVGPGGDSKVLLRGNRSITNSNEPLYVIDGVPLSGNVSMLNSDDIESMTVLKGASAAALYGSQGQNGAIVITTKRGKAGQTIVNYIGNYTIDKASVLPDLQFEYGQGDAGVYNANSEHSWGPKITGQQVELWNGHTVKMEGQPDRLKKYFRSAGTLNNTLSLQGGNDKMQSYFSYSNTLAQGIMRNNDMTRHNIDWKITNNITSKLTFFSKLSYIYERVDNRVFPGDGGTFALPSIIRSPVTIPLSEMEQYFYIDETGTERQSYWNPGSSVQLNPIWALHKVLNTQRRDRFLGLISAKYDFNNWLNLLVRGSMDKLLQNNEYKVFADNYFSQVGSDYDRTTARNLGINVDALLSFNHSLGKDFDITGNIGASLQESRFENTTENANGLNKANFFFMNNAKSPFVNNVYGRRPQVQSLYAAATLGYKEYLFLEVTARNDWSSALPKENQSYFYPSVGLSGIISDMVQLPSWVTYGKARITYASSGFGGTQYLDRNYYSVGSGGSISTPAIQSLGNYKPEITRSLEFGLDWRFLQNRLGFDLTYYNTQTKDQLLLIGIPGATLYSQKYINAGLIRNRGVEVTADFTPVKTNIFSWTVSGNYSKNVNKVEELTENMKSVIIGAGDAVYLIKVDEGSSYGDVYVRGWQRNEQGQRLVDDDGSPTLTDGTNVFVGNYNPDFMLGFSNTFRYDAFSLSFLIDHRQGGVVISGTQALIDADGHSKASLQGREGGIVLDGVNHSGGKNTTPVDAQKYFSLIGGRYPIAEFYSYSGTNTRLRELVLTYSLPASLLNKTKIIKKADVSVVGRNLFFFHKSAPIDPEITRGVNGGGLEYAQLPSTRNYGINLNLTF
ncbi:MAG: SusC/RagA family TonB-linked outer membrane protein [Chitinophagaceae bacterium]|nr:SusC/RagA family TonB-linked outer membrane protein [Chitinophagaceae bacterium]